MKIGIDYTPAVRQGGGIGRWTRSLVGALLEQNAPQDRHEYILFYAGGALNLQQENFVASQADVSMRAKMVRLPFSEPVLTRAWQRLRLPVPLELVGRLSGTNLLDKTELLHFPDFVVPPHRRGKPTIVTVHDLSFLVAPECAEPKLQKYLAQAVPRAVRKADHITVDAGAIKDDLINLLGVAPEKISVIYAGVSQDFRPIADRAMLEETRSRLNLPENFVLFLGVIEPRKNLARLAEAWKIVKEKPGRKKRRLVLAGRRGWLYEPIFSRIAELGLMDEITWLDFVPEGDLAAIYNLADLFVFPSIYEGFGIPPLEALACGTPIVTANNSSLAEVFTGASFMCDAASVESIADAIERALDAIDRRDPQLETLRQAGFERVKQFTWENAARAALNLYKELGDKR
jgi:glycosyltransferase involved in cell wall biosynthesis